jgi:nucleoside-diphosphate-sugar epimerase
METYEPPAQALQLVPYTASKLEGERRLRRELPSLPLVVVRPSIIVGHTRLGCRPSPSIYWVFRMARALRCFPCAPDSRIDIVPVDYCARAILHLLAAPRLAHERYHISAGAGASCTYREIDAAIAGALGEAPTLDYRQLDYEAIRAEQDRFDELLGPCIKPVMLRAIQLYGAFGSLDMLFDNRRLLAEGVGAPPRFTEYAGLCAVSAHGVPIASQMQYDFKGMPTRRGDALNATPVFQQP